MTEPSLPELEAERDRLYAQLSRVGDFRRGLCHLTRRYEPQRTGTPLGPCGFTASKVRLRRENQPFRPVYRTRERPLLAGPLRALNGGGAPLSRPDGQRGRPALLVLVYQQLLPGFCLLREMAVTVDIIKLLR